MKMPEWIEQTTKYTFTTENGAELWVGQHEMASDWSWRITMPSRFGTLRFGGHRIESAQKAKALALEAMPLADRLVALKTDFLRIEVPSDKIDMRGPDHATCMLCGAYSSIECLHAADEIRTAFALALRLGKHVPGDR
jgi:hypothetical protein